MSGAGRSAARLVLRSRRAVRTAAARVHGALRRGGPQRVLYFAADDLADLYLRRVHRAVAEVPHQGWFAGPDPAAPPGVTRRVSARWAPYRSWDLVVLANHAPLVFPPGTPMLGVLHGIVRSRPVAQGSYWYARARMLDERDRPVFRLLLDASEVSRLEGERFVPELTGRIAVVGDLRADDVLHAAEAAAPADQLLVMSTWGPEALVPRHLADLAPRLAEAAGALGLRVVVTSHPNLWRAQAHRGQRDHTADLLALADHGFTVLRPDDDWAPWLASSKVVLCDHTSLAANFALLDRPILPVAVDRSMIGAETFTSSLYEHVEAWSPGQDLTARLRAVLDEGLPAPVHAAATARCDHRGEADERVRAAFAQLLADLGAQVGK